MISVVSGMSITLKDTYYCHSASVNADLASRTSIRTIMFLPANGVLLYSRAFLAALGLENSMVA